jgi:hypothetical protein
MARATGMVAIQVHDPALVQHAYISKVPWKTRSAAGLDELGMAYGSDLGSPLAVCIIEDKGDERSEWRGYYVAERAIL